MDKTLNERKLRRILAAAALLVSALNGVAQVTDRVTLAWDPNSETDLAGYKVYWGTASRTYGPPVTLNLAESGHPAPTYSVTGLPICVRQYFAVTAWSTAGLESGYSNEVDAILYGDPDLDASGSVNVVDLQLMINAILGAGPGVDLDCDGAVNVIDLQTLINVILNP